MKILKLETRGDETAHPQEAGWRMSVDLFGILFFQNAPTVTSAAHSSASACVY